MLVRGALCLPTPNCDGNSSSREPKAAAQARVWGIIVCEAAAVPTLRLDVAVTSTGGSARASVFPLPQALPPLSSAAPAALPVPAEAPPPPLVAWLRRRFRWRGPAEMAAASTAFSTASSSSAALLRPGWTPLRRWRTLTRSASSSPRSAARYLAPIGSFFSSFSSFLLILRLILVPLMARWPKGRETSGGSAGSGPPRSPFGSPLSSAVLPGETGENQRQSGRRAGRGPGPVIDRGFKRCP